MIETNGLPGAVYARISQQYGENNDSLNNQANRCLDKAKAEGVHVPDDRILREQDSGHETADTRKLLLQLREWARRGEIGAVFIHNFDRLSRTPEELVTLWKEFLARGVKVICLTCPIHDLDVNVAKMMLRMYGMAGDLEWEFVRRRTTENKQQIRDAGKVVGEGGPRFGFTWDRVNRSRVPDDGPNEKWPVNAATIVRHIYTMLGVEGSTMRQVAIDLNFREWPCPSVYRGKKFRDGRVPVWTSGAVRLIVIDEQYKGVVTCQRTVMVGKKKHKTLPRDQWKTLDDARTEALVSEELWDAANRAIRANDIIGQRRRAKNAARTRNEDEFFFLRGLVYCGCCGGPMRAVSYQKWNSELKKHDGANGLDKVYRCESRRGQAERGVVARDLCYGKPVYDGRVRDAVWGAVVKAITDDGWIEREVARIKLERPGEALHRESLAATEAAIEESERQQRSLIKKLAREDDDEIARLIRDELVAIKAEAKSGKDRAGSLRKILASFDAVDERADTLLSRTAELRAGLADPAALSWQERRRFLDWLDVRITGNGTDLHLRLDQGVDPAFVIPEGSCRSSHWIDERLMISLPVQQLGAEYWVPSQERGHRRHAAAPV